MKQEKFFIFFEKNISEEKEIGAFSSGMKMIDWLFFSFSFSKAAFFSEECQVHLEKLPPKRNLEVLLTEICLKLCVVELLIRRNTELVNAAGVCEAKYSFDKVTFCH